MPRVCGGSAVSERLRHENWKETLPDARKESPSGHVSRTWRHPCWRHKEPKADEKGAGEQRGAQDIFKCANLLSYFEMRN